VRNFPETTRDAMQVPFDFAVVITTILRPSLREALASIYAQNIPGRVQILVGVDRPAGAHRIEALLGDIPANRTVSVLDPGYSTSVRNGGLHQAWDGGAMRSILALLANARHVAILDDDCWWHPDHLADLALALRDADWAYSQRYLVDQDSRETLGIDRWHSTGPGTGAFARDFGGFMDPNTLAFDKLRCVDVLHVLAAGPKVMSDRKFSSTLIQRGRGAATGKPTVYYTIRKTNVLWNHLRAA
jgi:hypothetical protein